MSMKIDNLAPFSLRGTDYIDEIQFRVDPSKNAIEVAITRKINQIRESLTFEQQRPGWERFARARQGGE